MFKFFLQIAKQELGSTALQKEKQKDYRNVVLMQTMIIVMGLTFTDFLALGGIEVPFNWFETLSILFAGLYFYLLWDLLKDFTTNKVLVQTVIIVLIIDFILAILTVNPIYTIIPETQRQLVFFIFHFALFAVETTVIGYSIVDIFRGEFMTPDKLWGSACVYLMIGIAFGSLYDIINIIQPGSFGEMINLGVESYAECIYYSMNVLGGLDTAYPNPTKLIRNIGVIEAVWGNLFIVLLIGNLLGLPRIRKDKNQDPGSRPG